MKLLGIKNNIVVFEGNMPDSEVDSFKNANNYSYVIENTFGLSSTIGMTYDPATNTLSGEPTPTPTPQNIVNPVQFKLLFTSSERIAIDDARKTDPVINNYFSLLDDVRLTALNLNGQSTIEAVQYLVTVQLITQERADQILSGVQP